MARLGLVAKEPYNLKSHDWFLAPWRNKNRNRITGSRFGWVGRD
jgi:hypothetical protein